MWQRLKLYADLVKFEHTIFALPFAYLGAFMGARGWPPLGPVIWITLAMAGARTAAMALNRLFDRKIDAANPRTAGRHIPAGLVKPGEVAGLAIVSLAVLLVAALNLNVLCVALFPAAALMVVAYSFMKRVSWLCHLFLGLTDAWAPFGGWIAVTGKFEWPALVLSLVVALWIGGFDIYYALQDSAYDRTKGLHSVPARFGDKAAVQIGRSWHGATVLLAGYLGFQLHLLSFHPSTWTLGGWLYFGAFLLLAVLLHVEYTMVKPLDMKRLNVAFFNMNSYISLGYFLLGAAAMVAQGK